jgi:hypothetical protein
VRVSAVGRFLARSGSLGRGLASSKVGREDDSALESPVSRLEARHAPTGAGTSSGRVPADREQDAPLRVRPDLAAEERLASVAGAALEVGTAPVKFVSGVSL